MALSIQKPFLVGTQDGSVKAVNYLGLSAADTDPLPIELVEYADRSAQIVGTFNGGSVTIEGSNNGEDWHPLTDPQGNPITVTSNKIEQIEEFTRYIRPKATGAGMTINVYFLFRRASGMRT